MSHLSTRLRRTLLAVVTPAVLVGAALVPAAPAAASAQSYTFVPIRLTVRDIQDDDVFPWTDWQDEPHLYYGGTDWVGLALRGGTDIITTYPMSPVTFTGQTISFDLWERDNNWTDNEFLGHNVSGVGQLDQELELKFAGKNWLYELRYKIVAG